MANIKFSQFTVGNTESDIDFVVGYKGANNIQISPANLLSATLAGYLPLTGGTMTGDIILNDDVRLRAGTGSDFSFFHDGSNSKINNNTGSIVIENFQDDGDIIFRNDDGSGGTATYFFLNGSSASSGSKYTQFPDNSNLTFGSADDLQIKHDGTDSKITNTNGDLYIRSTADDKDIIFQSDDGSGGLTTYFQLDGSSTRVDFLKNISIADNVQLNLGDSDDLRLIHTGTGGFIQNFTGDLQIQNNSDGDDILFRCDDGSGGLTTYFYLDGSSTTTVFSKNTRYLDNVEFRLGSGSDFKAYHSGTNTVLQNITGNLTILNSADDSDIIFQSDDGSGGIATYFFLDGSKAGQGGGRLFTKFPDNSTLSFGTDLGDLQIYHDGSNSYITDTGTGNLNIQGDNLLLKRGDGSQTYLQALTGSSVSLYHAGNKKLETTSSGVNVVSGTVAGSTHRLSVGKVASNIGNQKSILELVENTSGSDMNYGFSFTTDGDGSNNLLIRRHNNNTTGATVMTINRNDDNVTFAGNLKVQGVSEYADNTAAIAAGLTTGQLYRTGDLLKIVH